MSLAPCSDRWETVDGQIRLHTAGKVDKFGSKSVTDCLSLIEKQDSEGEREHWRSDKEPKSSALRALQVTVSSCLSSRLAVWEAPLRPTTQGFCWRLYRVYMLRYHHLHVVHPQVLGSPSRSHILHNHIAYINTEAR